MFSLSLFVLLYARETNRHFVFIPTNVFFQELQVLSVKMRDQTKRSRTSETNIRYELRELVFPWTDALWETHQTLAIVRRDVRVEVNFRGKEARVNRKCSRRSLRDLLDQGSSFVVSWYFPRLMKQCCDTSGPDITTRVLQRVTVTAVNDAKKCA